jgi:hypothetical protein
MTMQELRPLLCARPGCADRYTVHAPGGGACMVWDPATGEHCDCRGFQWVALSSTVTPPRRP